MKKFRRFNLKFIPHPLLILFIIFFICIGKGLILLYAFSSLFVHEFAHMFIAKRRGFGLDRLRLSPFGATLSSDSGLPDGDEFAVSVAGPASNFALCLLLIVLWWTFPFTYAYTLYLFRASFALGVFNLIPVLPFDGGRILLSLVKDKLRMLKFQKRFGLVLGFLFIVLGVLSVVFGYGYALIFAGCTLLWSTFFSLPKERYGLIFKQLELTSLPFPLEKTEIYVDSSIRLGVLLKRLASPKKMYIVHVTEKGKEVLVLSGENLCLLFFKNRKSSLSEILNLG